MDHRINRIRRKLASVPYHVQRSHSFGEETHQFQRGQRLTSRQVAEFEWHLGLELPADYRDFLRHIEGHGASPFYGVMPWNQCRLFTMNPPGSSPKGRGFTPAGTGRRPGEPFLHIIEAGCSDLVVIGMTGPLTGRVITGNGDGFWGPDVSPAPDFLGWYERWLDAIEAQLDDRQLHLTSPDIARAGGQWATGRVRTAARQESQRPGHPSRT